jgi:choline dehydrogenase-like flavoprotein
MAPRRDDQVVLDPGGRDAWGLPVLRIACNHSEQERQLATDQSMALREIGACLGIDFHQLETMPAVPGTAFHECGTARMGGDPGNSVLDPHNQCWGVKGLYVTDASAFPSQR